jgi:hypothetical protein
VGYNKSSSPKLKGTIMTTLKQLKEILGTRVDQVSKKKDGSFVARKGYFYRNGMNEISFKDRVVGALQASGINFRVEEFYDHWAAFNGGAALARSSHFAVVFTVQE